MKRFLTFFALLILAATARANHHEGDLAALQEVSGAIMEAWNGQKTEAMLKHFAPEAMGFGEDNGILQGFDVPTARAMTESGYRVQLRLIPTGAQLLGDTAAYTTGYLSGVVVQPGKGATRGVWRATAVWRKIEGQWKLAHWHHSPLLVDMQPMGGGDGGDRPMRDMMNRMLMPSMGGDDMRGRMGGMETRRERGSEEGERPDRMRPEGDRPDRERREGGMDRPDRERREGGMDRQPERRMSEMEGEHEDEMPAVVAIVRHEVEDFDVWAGAFREHAGMRGEFGSMGANVWRSAEKPNTVTVALQFRNEDRAEQFFHSEDLAEAMKKAGVVGEGTAWMVKGDSIRQASEMKEFEIGDAALMVHHKVERMEPWLKAFQEHGEMRAKAGSNGGYALLKPNGKENEVVVFLFWKNVDSARMFAGSDDLKEAMKGAGVIEQPAVSLLRHAFGTDR
ncbi:MAG: nuclear transport factor 2 family protein [Candidatus Poribacteria bacterium]|nr:nuclear transport factor 2 family protein [Candidatus Poribacteria bacterium]